VSNSPLPLTPEDAEELARLAKVTAWRSYRKNTRPFRRAFRGIISRKEAERFFISRARKSARAIEEATSE
jgi:hypothetical protein